MLFRPRDGLEFVVHLSDDRPLDLILALCAQDGVPHVKRYAVARNLGCMHAVAAHAGRRVDQRRHLAARLQQLVGYDQADVARAHHQDVLSGLHTVQVHQGLGCARADDAGLGPAVEQHHVFRCAGRDNDVIPGKLLHMVAKPHRNALFRENAEHGRVQLHVHACRFRLLQQHFADAESADLGLMLL